MYPIIHMEILCGIRKCIVEKFMVVDTIYRTEVEDDKGSRYCTRCSTNSWFPKKLEGQNEFHPLFRVVLFFLLWPLACSTIVLSSIFININHVLAPCSMFFNPRGHRKKTYCNKTRKPAAVVNKRDTKLNFRTGPSL